MQRAHFWIGLVVGAIVAAAIMFSVYYVPRRGISFSNDPIGFTLVLDQAHGLHAGSPVLVSGLEAGEVEAVEIKELPGKGYKVLVAVSVFDGERYGPMLRLDSTYQVAQSGILGEATIAIAPGGQAAAVAGELVAGRPPPDFTRILDDLTVISTRIADFVDGRQPGDPNLRRALVDLQETIRNVRDFSEKLPK
ncbi:MAG: MCE family protein [Deltaproteobacteria bacterium]|nr:MCE family protein [Deltaproteobacteria bacterium]